MSTDGLVAIAGGTALLTLCALALLLIPRLICFWTRRPGQGLGYALLQGAGWTLLLIAFLSQFPTYGIGLISFGILAAAGLLCVMLVEQRRRGQREVLLRMISSALQRRLPLTPVLETFGRDAVGWSGNTGAELAQALNQGMTLDRALEQAGDPLGDTASVMVRVGRESNNLDGALRTLAKIESDQAPLWRHFAGQLSYLAMVSLSIIVILMFTMIVTVPSMERIFREYQLDLPLMTQLVISLSHGVVNIGGYLLAPILAIGIPLGFIYTCWRFVGHSRSDLSRTGRLGMPLHRACILESLALAAEKGQPLESATGLLAAIYPRGFVRRRLADAHARMGQGSPWAVSLRDASLLRTRDLAALKLAATQNHLSWTLRELAATARQRFLQRAQALGQIAMPVILVGLGLLAAVIAISMFIPLVVLINSLT